MVKCVPVLGRKKSLDVPFHRVGGVAFAEAESPRHSENVRVHGDCGTVEGDCGDNGRGLSPHSRQHHQRIEIGRDFAVILFAENFTHCDDIFSLSVVVAATVNVFYQFLFRQGGKLLGRT